MRVQAFLLLWVTSRLQPSISFSVPRIGQYLPGYILLPRARA